MNFVKTEPINYTCSNRFPRAPRAPSFGFLWQEFPLTSTWANSSPFARDLSVTKRHWTRGVADSKPLIGLGIWHYIQHKRQPFGWGEWG